MQSLFSLDCEMFRSCLFFYVLMAANVKKKKHINRRMIRSGYDASPVIPLFRRGGEKAVPPRFGWEQRAAQASRQWQCTC
jgi:hypothetical protein